MKLHKKLFKFKPSVINKMFYVLNCNSTVYGSGYNNYCIMSSLNTSMKNGVFTIKTVYFFLVLKVNPNIS